MMRSLVMTLVCGALAATAAGQEPPDVPTVRVHDVRDLLHAPRNFPPMQLGIGRNLPKASTPPDPDGRATEQAAAASLVREARALSGIAWPAGTSIEARQGSLVVRQHAAGHAAIAGWLERRRQARGRMVNVEARFIALANDRAKKLPRGLHVIDATQARRLLDLAKTGERASLLVAPKITAFENQLANVVIANQKSYVSHLEVRVRHHVIVADPVIDTVSDGVVLALRAHQVEPGWIAAELDIQHATLLRPIPELKTRYGTVQVPELVSQRLRLHGRVPDGGWALCSGLVEVTPGGASGRPVVVLVRCKTGMLDAHPRKK